MVKEPESMNELIYFTNRTLDTDGKIRAWVYRKECPKCHKTKMGKPVEKGKVKSRAKEYVCPSCGFTEELKQHEESLMLEIKYTCPYCGHSGEATTEYKRKMVDGIPSYVFACQKCGKKIPITKKLKEKKGDDGEDEG